MITAYDSGPLDEVRTRAIARVENRSKQEVAREGAEQAPQPVPFRVLDFATEERGGHLVSLVDDHEVP
jgi:hypothetical protein